uniref:SET domain-containing protein n=1 Tax=Eutreptiella gymnastica TaxID=73025 RepID=A0A7S4D1U5_9EUGL
MAEPTLEVIDFAAFGRSLVSRKPFEVGQVVLKESPLVEWDPRQISEDVKALAKKHGIEPHLPSILTHYSALDPDLQGFIFELSTTSLPIEEATTSIYAFAWDLQSLSEAMPPAALCVRVMMSTWQNAHKQPNGNLALYRQGSKIAHSCAPNVMFNGTEFVCIQPINVGDLVTFAYFGLMNLTKSSLERQVQLKQTHWFVCNCARCLDVDYGRQLPCLACHRGRMLRLGTPFSCAPDDALWFARKYVQWRNPCGEVNDCKMDVWQCEVCGVMKSDLDLEATLSVECDVGKQLRDVSDSNTVHDQRYETLRDLMSRVISHLGRHHWMYARLTFLLAVYYRDFGHFQSEDIAWQFALSWGALYLQALKNIKCDTGTPYCHVTVAAFQMSMVSHLCKSSRLRTQLRAFAETAHPLMLAIYGPDDADVEALNLCLHHEDSCESRQEDSQMLQSFMAEVRNAAHEDELFALWEKIRQALCRHKATNS